MAGPWTTLVDAKTLRAHLTDDDLVLLDCRHVLTDPEAGPAAYAAGHIEGAVHAHIDHDLSGPPGRRTGRHPLPDPDAFRARCGTWGIGTGTQVVAYDERDGNWAARAWWLLRDHGHGEVAVLDGGLAAWREAGGALTQAVRSNRARAFVGAPGHLPRVDAASITRRLPVPRGSLLDARLPERYHGEVEPMDRVPGHIPGAVNAPYTANLGPDGRFLPPDELHERYEAILGERRSDEAAVYCGSGVTATHVLLALEVAGHRGAALYPGSYSEWVSDPSRPVERSPRTKPNGLKA